MNLFEIAILVMGYVFFGVAMFCFCMGKLMLWFGDDGKSPTIKALDVMMIVSSIIALILLISLY